MKKVVLQSIIVLLGLYSTQSTAQKMPRRVYNATAYNEPATNPNSPRYTSSLIMEYTDGTTSYANISEIKRTIPGARRELRLGAAAVWGQAGLVFPLPQHLQSLNNERHSLAASLTQHTLFPCL